MKNITYIPGFAGTKMDYNSLTEKLPKTYNNYFLELPFHKPCSLEVLLESLFEENLELWKNCDYICGYSMGGRIAVLLSQMLRARLKDEFQGNLILISSGLGFLNKDKRKAREAEDKKKITHLLKDPPSFWKNWYEQEIFCSFKDWEEERREEWIERRLEFNSDTLAKSLENWSPAKHPYLLPLLKEEKKILYITGERDRKYEGVARILEHELIGSCAKIVPEASHLVMEDRAEDCAKLIHHWVCMESSVKGK